jgi:hypothetical protein
MRNERAFIATIERNGAASRDALREQHTPMG